METDIEITGRPGQWYVTNYQTGENAGPYFTRSEIKDKLNKMSEEKKVLFRMIIERDETGKISEVKVVLGRQETQTTPTENVEQKEIK